MKEGEEAAAAENLPQPASRRGRALSNKNPFGGRGATTAVVSSLENATANKTKQRVSYQLRCSSQRGTRLHCFGVNALALEEESEGRPTLLYSGGRDSSIRCWDLSKPGPPVHMNAFENHTDWVNDLALCNSITLASCSSDTTIKIWRVGNALTETRQQTNSEEAEEEQEQREIDSTQEQKEESELSNKQNNEEDKAKQIESKAKEREVDEREREEERESCLLTLQQHQDYVKAISYAPQANLLASVGLDSTVRLWDIASALTRPFSSLPSSSKLEKWMGHTKHSFYSVCMNAAATLVVTGSPEKVVRGWDPRVSSQSGKLFKLRGHKDNIKTVCLSEDGNFCLSGSSDGTVKLWDLGQQSCIQTFMMHDEAAVWSIAAHPSFAYFYSADRLGFIHYTQPATGLSSLAYEPPQLTRGESSSTLSTSPVLKLLLPSTEPTSLWFTTARPEIRKLTIVQKQKRLFGGTTSLEEEEEKGEEKTTNAEKRASSDGVNSNLTSTVQASESYDEIAPSFVPVTLELAPDYLIPGRPGIIRAAILNDKIHVLTEDDAGLVQMFNVIKGVDVHTFGSGAGLFQRKHQELQKRLSIPSWFAVDTKTGAVTVQLSNPHCFGAEIYGWDAGLDLSTSDTRKVNLGEHVLYSLFMPWLRKVHSRARTHRKQQQQQNSNDKRSSVCETEEEAEAEELLPPSGLPLFQLPEDLCLIISDERTGATLYRCPIGQSHLIADHLPDVMPPWVKACLLEKKKATREVMQFGFFLFPLDPKDLPELPHKKRRLTAHRALKVRKVIRYVINKLELELPTNKSPSTLSHSATDSPTSAQPSSSSFVSPSSPAAIAEEDYIEILCNNQVLQPDDDLATIKTFVWKRTGGGRDAELTLHYRRKQQWLATPASFTSQKTKDNKSGSTSASSSPSLSRNPLSYLFSFQSS
ncbi:Serine/threonine-protein kinase smu1 [Balamuthia mandrillaris]